MKNLIAFVCFTACLMACSGGDKETSTSKPKAETAAASKIDGGKIYKTYCVTCHGIYGDMGGSGAFDLTKTELTLEERIQVITKGRNLMTPFEGLLSEEKIKAVAEYVGTLKK